jgi:hypothetical protein
MRKIWRILMITTTAIALCTACSDKPGRDVASIGGTATPGHAPTSTVADGQDQFVRCLKDHGAAPQQIEVNGDSGTVNQPALPEAEQRKQQQAQEACRQFLPNGGNPQPMNPEQLEQARAIAKCMRAAGVSYPDPDPNLGGGGNNAGSMPIPDGVDLKNPAVAAKLNECSHAAGVGGAGPSGGK